jgi:hypothetical protein
MTQSLLAGSVGILYFGGIFLVKAMGKWVGEGLSLSVEDKVRIGDVLGKNVPVQCQRLRLRSAIDRDRTLTYTKSHRNFRESAIDPKKSV